MGVNTEKRHCAGGQDDAGRTKTDGWGEGRGELKKGDENTRMGGLQRRIDRQESCS